MKNIKTKEEIDYIAIKQSRPVSNGMNQKKLASALAFLALSMPIVAFGDSLIPCGQPAGTSPISVAGMTYQTTNECGFNDLIILINVIVHFLMIDVAVPLAALGFMFVGARMVLSPNKESSMTEAKEAAGDIIKGFLIMLAAYVLIKTIIYAFLNTKGGYFTFFLQ